MNKRKNALFRKIKVGLSSLSMLLFVFMASAQPTSITLEECYRLAHENYPLIKKQELLLKSKDYSIQNLSKGYLPQLNISGQATYQSAVTQIPIQIPNNPIPSLSKDQYRLYGEVSQILFDGGIIKTQKESQEIGTKVEEQHLEVNLYQLKSRINQLYFGILLIDQQLKQNNFLKEDIQLGLNKILAAIHNGVSLKSEADILKAELLTADQQRIEMIANRKAFIDMLSMFMQQPLDKNTILVQPLNPSLSNEINRPELSLFNFQNQKLQSQQDILNAKNRPKFSFFAQGGAGRPALNMLSNSFEAFYLAGVKMNIPLSGFYTLKNDKALISLRQQDIEIQREVFLFNTRIEIKQQNAEIAKFQELLLSDDEIVELRNNIKKTALIRLDNGVITSNDYMKEVVSENQARQRKALHEMQLLMASYDLKTVKGN